MEEYKTISSIASATIYEKKSEFIGHIAPVQTEEEALAFLQKIRIEHRDANHNVFAYNLKENAKQRCSDDGEPSKTAGLPILHVLTNEEILNCIIVVTRYFGGTLLGTGGLVRAYTSAAKAALNATTIAVIQPCVPITLTMPYSFYEKVLRILSAHGAAWQEPIFTDTVTISLTLPLAGKISLLEEITEYSRGEILIVEDDPIFLAFSPTNKL